VGVQFTKARHQALPGALKMMAAAGAFTLVEAIV
jgi:hypothetical protein